MEEAHSPLITDPVAVLVVLLAVLAAIFWFGETQPGKRLFAVVPSLIFCYFLPTPECSFDIDCPLGEVCNLGFCQPGGPSCMVNADCPDGYLCISMICQAGIECLSDGDCPMGELCVMNQCTP